MRHDFSPPRVEDDIHGNSSGFIYDSTCEACLLRWATSAPTATSRWTDKWIFLFLYKDFVHFPYFCAHFFLLQAYDFTNSFYLRLHLHTGYPHTLPRHTSCLGPPATSIMRNLVQKTILDTALGSVEPLLHNSDCHATSDMVDDVTEFTAYHMYTTSTQRWE